MLRDRLRRLGPIAWRDARIAELKARVDDLQRRLDSANATAGAVGGPSARHDRPQPGPYRPDVPSWHARIREQQRVQRAANAVDTQDRHPRRRLFRKLHNYEVARGLGVATPQVYGVWQDVADVAWDSLPDRFVLKSNGGSTARGVLPLERVRGGLRLVDGTRTYTAEEVVTHFTEARGAARPPYFAETLLSGTEEALPDDIKIYAFYGEVAFVMLRRMPVHGVIAQGSTRMLTATGEHLDGVQRTRQSDPGVPVPEQLALMVETAAVMSLALPLPFVRVDAYAAGSDGLVLGELTPLPGDSHTFTAQWDRRLGEMYDAAEARLQVDLASGRPYGVLYGTHDRSLTRDVVPTTVAPPPPRW